MVRGKEERRKSLRGKESHEKFKIKIVEVCSNIPNVF